MNYDVNTVPSGSRLELTGRERLVVSGVEDVERFDETGIVMILQRLRSSALPRWALLPATPQRASSWAIWSWPRPVKTAAAG